MIRVKNEPGEGQAHRATTQRCGGKVLSNPIIGCFGQKSRHPPRFSPAVSRLIDDTVVKAERYRALAIRYAKLEYRALAIRRSLETLIGGVG